MPEYIDGGTTYEVEVVSVTDGDTIDVRFADGMDDEVRVIGIDTPETERNRRFETPAEWRGIQDPDTLAAWGERATQFATDRLADATVTISFDPSEPIRGTYGRLIAYVEYEADGESVFYNRELVSEGYARAYHSGITTHDELVAAEERARANDRGLWTDSDPDATEPIRNDPVDQLFVPRAQTIRTASGALPDGRTVVRSESSGVQRLRADSAVDYGTGPLPLVGVDRDARVAAVGGLLVDEDYELSEEFPVDTTRYGQFPFVTNLLDWLADRDGDVLLDGGHGQFGVDFGLSLEEVAVYRQYLEGQGLSLLQYNRLPSTVFDRARAILVTTPVSRFGPGEIDRIRAFRDDGGSVVLLGSATAPPHARENLDHLADALGSDLRFNADAVRDGEHTLNDDPTLPTTTVFDRSFPLFDPFETEV